MGTGFCVGIYLRSYKFCH